MGEGGCGSKEKERCWNLVLSINMSKLSLNWEVMTWEICFWVSAVISLVIPHSPLSLDTGKGFMGLKQAERGRGVGIFVQ